MFVVIVVIVGFAVVVVAIVVVFDIAVVEFECSCIVAVDELPLLVLVGVLVLLIWDPDPLVVEIGGAAVVDGGAADVDVSPDWHPLAAPKRTLTSLKYIQNCQTFILMV